MKVLVLGAGVIGTTSAWYLARAGHEVMVVDRQPEPALETSFANGGQISVSHAQPWANPGAPRKALRWLGREDAPLLFRPSTDPAQWLWGMRFLFECLPHRTRRNTANALALARYSARLLGELRAATGIRYDEQTRGILQLFFSRRDFEEACAPLALLRERGLEVREQNAAQCVALEPALAAVTVPIVGGIHAPGDESGDAHLFTTRLAESARAAGVQFRFNVSVTGIQVEAGRVGRVIIDDEAGIDESLRADAYVVALGSYSPLLLKGVGVSIPVYPVKGYSLTLPLRADDMAPHMSLSDDSHKLVFSRLGERLRVAGTAELNGYDTSLNETRCQALLSRTRELFPRIGRDEEAQYWTGLRPATPSNQPLIGRSRYPNLYINTGHGTLGWTLACGSGRVLSDIVSGKVPEIDVATM
ncbi:MAG: amino acid dehydrogenase [Betaproteobacteria bacterium RIFCSPLOWO2_02_FULL_62_17]|nr:MAG: amino acid dehydrogenase [Betaproteobacteria bacterium RIFCSPLOWO2_02_FULL_62_17]